MHFVDKNIEDYCKAFSSLPSSHCQAIEDFTRANVPMSVMLTGPLVGSFLSFLMRTQGARRVLEVGCYTGYSALFMAEAMPEDGTLVTLDKNPETGEIAKSFWNKSPHGKKISLVLGNASESIKKLNGTFDFVFIDADKAGYVGYLEQTLPLLSPGGLIAADNSLYSGQVLEESPSDAGARAIKEFNRYIHSRKDLISCLLPLRDGIHLVRKA